MHASLQKRFFSPKSFTAPQPVEAHEARRVALDFTSHLGARATHAARTGAGDLPSLNLLRRARHALSSSRSGGAKTVYRGVSGDFARNLMPGAEIEDKAPFFATNKPRVALGFAQKQPHGALLRIRAPAGSPAIDLEGVKNKADGRISTNTLTTGKLKIPGLRRRRLRGLPVFEADLTKSFLRKARRLAGPAPKMGTKALPKPRPQARPGQLAEPNLTTASQRFAAAMEEVAANRRAGMVASGRPASVDPAMTAEAAKLKEELARARASKRAAAKAGESTETIDLEIQRLARASTNLSARIRRAEAKALSATLADRPAVDARLEQARNDLATAAAKARQQKESQRLAQLGDADAFHAMVNAKVADRLQVLDTQIAALRRQRGAPKAASISKAKREDFCLQIEKAAASGKYVAGWASVIEVDGQPVTDIQGDVIGMDELRKSAHTYVTKARAAKVMHDGAIIGEVVESVLIDGDFAKCHGITHGKRGWWIAMAIADPDVQKQVRAGIFKGFSIGGSGERKPIVEKSLAPGRLIGRGRTKDVYAHRTKPNVVVVQMQRSPEAESFLEFARDAHRHNLPEAKHLPRVTRTRITGDRITYAAERLQPNPTRARIGRDNGRFFATGVGESERKPLLNTVEALDAHLRRKHPKGSYYYDMSPQNFMRRRNGNLVINDPVESRR